MSGKFQAPKGVSEYLPPRSQHFEFVMRALESVALAADYKLIELPIFEDTELFTRGVGESTDVVSKEMYTFEDRGGRSLTLRPEGTAGVMRAVIEHGLDRGQLPIKLFYRGPFFRAERPQAGRYRQFYQFGIEAIGVDDPLLDAETIAIAHRGFQKIGLSDFTLEITSLGDGDTRARHRADLLKFLGELQLDAETKERVAKNPLRIFDDKRSEIRAALTNAPVLLNYLSQESAAKFEAVQSALNDLQIPFQINPRMVRGLDYYTGTAFEFVHNQLGAQSSIGGGGRYDGLMATLGGQSLSGIGFGLGVDRIIMALESERSEETPASYLDLYVIPLGEAARMRALVLVDQARGCGLVADLAYGERALKGAMKGADRRSARHVLVIGESELAAGTGQLKRMSDGSEQSITLATLIETLRADLSR